MKSDVIVVDSQGAGIAEALRQAELTAQFRELGPKDTLHLRLLTEEMMGIVKGIAGSVQMRYWIDCDPKKYALHLESEIVMDLNKREQLLEVSSSGKNSAAKGITGKLRDFFEESMCATALTAPYYNPELTLCNPASSPELYASVVDALDVKWSMNNYKAQGKDSQEAGAKDAWDELEKSIVANLAEEITIGIRGNHVELTVYYTAA